MDRRVTVSEWNCVDHVITCAYSMPNHSAGDTSPPRAARQCGYLLTYGKQVVCPMEFGIPARKFS
jgi:hypothetical protein